jgi:hypothetical protein
MKTRELEKALAGADPVGRGRLDRLDLEAMEADLVTDVGGTPSGLAPVSRADRRPRLRRRGLALAAAALASMLVAMLVLAGGGDKDSSSSAYGAALIRFAESTPLLLLEGPGWRVQNVFQHGNGEGTMEFVTGKPVPYESIRVTGNVETGQYASGMLPPGVRQRKVELNWRPGNLGQFLRFARGAPHPHGQRWVEAPVLDTSAQVDTRAEVFVNQGGPGDRHMVGFWSEGGLVLEMRAAVPSLAAFEERLDWLTRVDSETWLDAMPAKVVKAADHDAAVREMLKGIPVPDTFDPSRVPDEGLTTNRYQVGGAVTGTVACLWFRQWGEARRTGDRRAEVEAEKAMATSKRWPILREMAKEGGYPSTIWRLAAAMPSGEWPPRGWRLLPKAEALGCARMGIPVLPRKQRLQREREHRTGSRQ